MDSEKLKLWIDTHLKQAEDKASRLLGNEKEKFDVPLNYWLGRRDLLEELQRFIEYAEIEGPVNGMSEL